MPELWNLNNKFRTCQWELCSHDQHLHRNSAPGHRWRNMRLVSVLPTWRWSTIAYTESGSAVRTWSCAVACCGDGSQASDRLQVDVPSQCTESVLTGSTECCRQMETFRRLLVSAAVFRMSARVQDCLVSPQTQSTPSQRNNNIQLCNGDRQSLNFDVTKVSVDGAKGIRVVAGWVTAAPASSQKTKFEQINWKIRA